MHLEKMKIKHSLGLDCTTTALFRLSPAHLFLSFFPSQQDQHPIEQVVWLVCDQVLTGTSIVWRLLTVHVAYSMATLPNLLPQSCSPTGRPTVVWARCARCASRTPCIKGSKEKRANAEKVFLSNKGSHAGERLVYCFAVRLYFDASTNGCKMLQSPANWQSGGNAVEIHALKERSCN